MENIRDIETEPRLDELREQFESRSKFDRTYDGRERSWDEVLNAIPDLEDFLAGVETLEDPNVFFVNEHGQLLVGDGCVHPPSDLEGIDYFNAALKAHRVSYRDFNGEIKVKVIPGIMNGWWGNELNVLGKNSEIPNCAQILSERGLININEYCRINFGRFFQGKHVWMGGGHRISWKVDVVSWGGRGLGKPYEELTNGLFDTDEYAMWRMLRVKLDL